MGREINIEEKHRAISILISPTLEMGERDF
jgi:hypothetical protein